MKEVTALGTLLLVTLALAGIAAASPVTLNYSGTVSSVIPPPVPSSVPVVVGNNFSFTVTYNTSATPVSTGSTTTAPLYKDAIYDATSASATIGGTSIPVVMLPTIQIRDYTSSSAAFSDPDIILEGEAQIPSWANASLGGNPTVYFEIDLEGLNSPLTSLALPTAIGSSEFPVSDASAEVVYTSSKGVNTSVGVIDGGFSLKLTNTIPEPSTIMLVGGGLAGLAGMIRRRSARKG